MEQGSLKWVGLKFTFSSDTDYFFLNLTFEWCKKWKKKMVSGEGVWGFK